MSKKRIIILSLFLILVTIFFIPSFGVKNQFISFFSAIGKPFSGISGSIKGFFSDIRSAKELSNTNDELAAKNNQLEADISALQELKNENTKLREELGLVKSTQNKLVGAQVISKSIVPYLQNIIIDKGEVNGIKKGQVVLSQGHLAGIISEVYKDFSKVELLTSSKVLIPVILQNSRSIGILHCQLDGFFIENIPIDDKVEINENVLTNNLVEGIPADILIGKVEKITTYKSQIFQTVKINSPLEFSKIDLVFVITNESL